MDFCTSIHCMDGRVQNPIQNYLKEKYSVKYIDSITEPGPCKILAEDKDKSVIDSIHSRIRISLEKHQSSLIAISGHHDCAGNPNTNEEQKQQVLQSMKFLKELYPRTEVVGLWVDGDWEVNAI
jgi:hypothetical protein